MKRLSILVLSICLAGLAKAQVDACISVTSSHIASGKTVYICRGEWINLTGNDCSGNTASGSESYSWVNLSNPGVPMTSKTISVPDTGRWELTFTNTSDWTTDKDTMYVRFYSQPTFNINGNVPVITKCNNVNVTLTASSHTDFSNYNWYITGDPTSLGTNISLDIAVVPGGGAQFYAATALYSVTGCTVSDTIYVTTFPTPEPFLGNDTTLCDGESLLLLPTNLSSPRTQYQYRWYNSGSFANNDSMRTVNTSGTYYVTLRGPNPYTCLGSDTINVTFTPLPTVEAGANATICFKNSVTFSDATASGGGGAPYTYSWSPADSLSDSSILSPVANPTTTTTYTLTVTSKNCSASDSRTVTVNPDLVVTVPFADTTLCKGDMVTLGVSASGGTPFAGPTYNYTWTPSTGLNNASVANPQASPVSPVNYTVTVRDQRNCEKTAMISTDILWVNLVSADTLGTNGDSIKLGVKNPTHAGFDYRWKNSSGTVIGTDSVIWVKSSGKYIVEVYNSVTNCFVSDSINALFLAEVIQDIYVPSAFNPEMSEADDAHLRVYGNNVSNNSFLFRVYNKWGQVVYETTSFTIANQEGWNGNMENTGAPLTSGVYTYTVSGEFFDGTKFEKAGTASLLK